MWAYRDKLIVITTILLFFSNSYLLYVNGINESFSRDEVSSEKLEGIDNSVTINNPIMIYSYYEMILNDNKIYLFENGLITVLNVSQPDNHEILYSCQIEEYSFYYQNNVHWFPISNNIFLNVYYGEEFTLNDYLLYFNFYEIINSEFTLINSNEFNITNYSYIYSSCFYLDEEIYLMADKRIYNETTSEYIHDSYFLTYNLSDSSNVTLENEFSFEDLDYSYYGFAIRDEYIFMNSFEQLDIRNFSDTTMNLLHTIIYNDDNGRGFKFYENNIMEISNIQSGYQTVDVNEYTFYDITDVINPIELYTLIFPLYWQKLVIQDDLAIYTKNDILRFYDISDKDNLEIISEYEVKKQGIGHFEQAIMSEDYLFATRECEYKDFMFYIFDISDLNEPIKFFPFGTSLSSTDREKIFMIVLISLYIGLPVLFIASGSFLVFKITQKRKNKKNMEKKLDEQEMNLEK